MHCSWKREIHFLQITNITDIISFYRSQFGIFQRYSWKHEIESKHMAYEHNHKEANTKSKQILQFCLTLVFCILKRYWLEAKWDALDAIIIETWQMSYLHYERNSSDYYDFVCQKWFVFKSDNAIVISTLWWSLETTKQWGNFRLATIIRDTLLLGEKNHQP